ncbi:MAG TPA: hypothetical protein VFI87_09220 [Hyphomicrobiaceae bacterium]|nr:hypothetical protein [Hyphomicrobiaceae bacterium]
MQLGPVGSIPKRCEYCREPFFFSDSQVQALPVGNQFVCSEFCAQALREETTFSIKRAS